MRRSLTREPRTPIEIDFWDPHGMGVCDGCAFWVNYRDLRKHMAYRGGTTPVWDGLLVCSKCYDVPNPAPQFSRLTLFPDPVPFANPRPESSAANQSGFGYLTTETGLIFNTMSDGDVWGGEFINTIPPTVYP